MQENLSRALRSYYRLDQFKKSKSIDFLIDQENQILKEAISNLTKSELETFHRTAQEYIEFQTTQDESANDVLETQLNRQMATLH